MQKRSFITTTSVEMVRIYFLCLLVNLVVLIFANKLAPQSVVFGTSVLTPNWGLFLSMGTLSLLNLLFVPFFEQVQEELQRELTSKEWMVGYFILNFVGLWLISRFAEQLGLGISSWWVGAILAFILDMLQGFAIMRFAYEKK
ncbi:hypothetical protein A2572_01030 [Candidatus Collierbacteria bacterium RIFOXYD1_FULL_40_9]|uniref:Uncharacterized protein n=1 Tax=Candidatus Collierbacteria bacterium RIFOXYD1_FULL_40_9 TaxID=1817731 RepID=A0A1F5FTS5_9BACT|nr:MAG: hypothetical protein A2572_01030 [Candidatus Collierbacteria bacterium RIFOXYD1_FULL_40_9]